MAAKRKKTDLPGRWISRDVVDPLGREVVQIETLSLQAGQVIRFVFESTKSPRRQGVWLAVKGRLEVAGAVGDQIVLWSDTAPSLVKIKCLQSAGMLHFYNIYNSGDHNGHKSLSYKSGMAVEDLGHGWKRYACNDFGDPDSEKLVFRICIE